MLNRTFIPGWVAAASFVGLAACTRLPVTTDVNPTMSVSNCHTYTFAQEHVANTDQPSAFGNPLNAERLRVAIESNLAARGIQRASDRGAAECVVGYAMGSRQVFNDYYGGFGVGFGGGFRRGGFGGGFGGWGYDGPWVQDETRIAIDLFEAHSHKPIWHASVSQSVSDLTGPNAEAKINAGTAAIFAKFPIAAPPPASGGATT
jgi:Domain of unknown function (DUF4136)